MIEEYGYTTHMMSHGKENIDGKKIPGFRTRRWVIERHIFG